jgi:hypothetical protein
MRVKSSVTSAYVCAEFPLKVVSEANRRDHWRTKHTRTANQKDVVGWELVKFRPVISALGLPLVVRLTLIGCQKLDGDNLQAALKAVRDSVAKTIGIDDGDPRITWLYEFELINKRDRRVRIEIEKRAA